MENLIGNSHLPVNRPMRSSNIFEIQTGAFLPLLAVGGQWDAK
jgi:hypothetical protein